ncbi:Non-specific serine/threonine protein kinase [Sulfidibacter corallicola]|uniref:Serine/threonine protein kinase n=1 Tax=Sulfidibacter corallicola TaxID=2818388 RepID=A0A8A4TWC3_SULCO|nr:serine/threonine-protein kinase [Sulfidibacter corallicola]QTD50825.1 serine/threonine protein kinase [Sulfidibacter corallicola]
MDLAREQRIMRLMEAAMDVPKAHRAAFLDKQCGDDVTLRQTVQARLAVSCGSLSFIEKGVIEGEYGVGTHIGAFRIVRELGEGGMGIVYLAEQTEPISRFVSLKILKKGLDTPELIQRFEYERQILANLAHPYVARLLDGAQTEDGRPYFIMEYIQGTSILEYCRQFKLSIFDRLKLFLKVCEAVAFAHKNSVIHRDIKPSNILVMRDGTPKLLDFGIAKFTESGPYGVDTSTEYKGRLMTPDYASPEQAKGEPVDHATDIYSMGVLLYELLTERRPYYFKNRMAGPVCQVICEQDPIKPSKALGHRKYQPKSTYASFEPPRKRAFCPRQLKERRRLLAGDLDSIVMTTLRKDPGERYSDIESLARDIECFLNGEPVRARRAERLYRIEKTFKRHSGTMRRWVLAAAAVSGMGWFIHFQAAENAHYREILGNILGRANTQQDALPGDRTELGTVRDPSHPSQAGDGPGRERPESSTHERNETARSLGSHEESQAQRTQIIREDLRPDSVQAAPQTARHTESTTARPMTGAKAVPAAGDRIAPAYVASPSRSLAHIAHALEIEGRFDEAEELYRVDLEQKRTQFGDDHLETASAYTALGTIQERQGRHHEAEVCIRQALAIRQKMNGPVNPAVAASLDQLAGLLETQERYSEADPLRWRAVNARFAYYGNDNPVVIPSLQSLAGTLEKQERFREAQTLYQRIMDLGANDPQSEATLQVATLDNLARIQLKTDNPAGAEHYYKRVLDIRLKAFGREDPATIAAFENLADVLKMQDKLEEAETLYREALNTREITHGSNDPVNATTLDRLADVLRSQGREAEAETLIDRQAEIKQVNEEEEHPEVSHLRADLRTPREDNGDQGNGANSQRDPRPRDNDSDRGASEIK